MLNKNLAAFTLTCKIKKITVMNTKSSLLFLGLLIMGLNYYSCTQTNRDKENKTNITETNVVLKDYGTQPTVLNIEDYTEANSNYRTALWTGTYLQLTVMSIPVKGDVGLEQHMETDQFLRVESGKAKVMMGNSKDALTFVKEVGDNFAIIIPAGKWHNIINIGNEPLKLYSIYAPVHHPFGTVHKTQQDAEEQEKE